MTKAIESYGAHLAHYRQFAYISSKEQYEDLYKRSLEDADNFWAEQAIKYLSWYKQWDSVPRVRFPQGRDPVVRRGCAQRELQLPRQTSAQTEKSGGLLLGGR